MIHETLEKFLTIDTMHKIASEIAEYFVSNINKDNFDFSFDVNPKTFKMTFDEDMFELPIEEWDFNSNFQYDAPTPSSTRDLISIISQLEDISDEDYALMSDLLMTIRDDLNIKYVNSLKNAVRENIFKQKEDKLPLKTFVVGNVEIDKLPDPKKGEGSPYIVSVSKMVNERNRSASSGVSAELMEIYGETGKHPNDIIKEKKEAGDPMYDNVVSAELKKYIYEIRLDMFIDYTQTFEDQNVPEKTGNV